MIKTDNGKYETMCGMVGVQGATGDRVFPKIRVAPEWRRV